MLRRPLFCMISFLVASSLLVAQDEGKMRSGPQAGSLIPGAFECFNVNGPAKGRPRCLVCQFALNPAVLIFTREPAEGKDAAFSELLKKLDELTVEFEERTFSVGVVVISPDALDSTYNAKETDVKKLVDEAVKREKLNERLTKRAEGLKNAIIGYVPEAPKSYKINPKADVTILYYERMKITGNWAFGPDQMQMKDVEAIVKHVRDTLPIKKKLKT
jgi:hypothetical protein